ncbi:hypothetical protein EB796_005211 [Bugula neritina]|uniref:Uncharacterized protein n=1 Tax=Bugula neritina TaxID=10212 RepID=A0A7J7KFR1_BUGNE|nr:hypothetical protein EB796_005211 [Bugula neritina]
MLNFHQTSDAEQADIAGGEKNSLSVPLNQEDWKTTSAFGRINFCKDAKSTYEPPIFLFAILPIMVPLLKFVRKKDADPRMDERQSDPLTLLTLPEMMTRISLL